MIQPYRLTWWDDPKVEFNLDVPHWGIQTRLVKLDDGVYKQYLLMAAVMATSPDHAKGQIVESYDDTDPDLEWLAVEEQPFGWSPFSKQTPRTDWMVWDQRPH